ncbi:hypothetical protein Ddye_020786 [Dipteronia dyeriana]|uniref:RNase H type-1 domain-containing protein n=1 Tax=Dipteronia dyeriana TaxID=168575 RepID=A0AAD9U166_9ROSI|nr:hypothetical protein Ddye_020786 [Dipteronia dyeriana]
MCVSRKVSQNSASVLAGILGVKVLEEDSIDVLISSSSTRVGIHWKLPSTGMSKINTDAAIDGVNGKVGIGIIIRSDAGKVLASGAQVIFTSYSAQVTEAMAILRGFQLGMSLGLGPCVVESDALGVVSLINNNQPPY